MHSATKNDDLDIKKPFHKPGPLAGMPIGPATSLNLPIIRYMYEGGQIGQARLCHLQPTQSGKQSKEITVSEVIEALQNDGVDFNLFYACAYESERSTGGWMPLEPVPRDRNPWNDVSAESAFTFNIPPPENASVSRRIDIKLFRRPKTPSKADSIQSLDDVIDAAATQSENEQMVAPVEHSSDALHAISASIPGGKLPIDGYFGIGIFSPKTSSNVGTLWRSAYQLGASILYTIGGRYKASSTDTLNVPARIPFIELDDWSSFAEWSAPKAAVWVAIEMGGTPLTEFKHPRNAIYILGSEDHGLPKSVVRGCREVVSLESEFYGSYNVAVAGSIVMYDRLMKRRKAEKEKPS